MPAIAPDVAILHVQRADEEGHAHVWGTLGVTRQAALAARRVIMVAEEIRPRARILSDPGLVLTPALKVAAVVHEPFGAFPSPVQGHYGRRHDFYHRFHEDSRTVEGFQRWLGHWVHGVSRTGPGFLSRLDAGVLDALRVTPPSFPSHSTTEPDAMKITAIEAVPLAIPTQADDAAVALDGRHPQADLRARAHRRGRHRPRRGLRLRRAARGGERHRGEPRAPASSARTRARSRRWWT